MHTKEGDQIESLYSNTSKTNILIERDYKMEGERMSGFCITKARNVRNGGSNCGSTGTKCGRWNPTCEQVKLLTDLFRSGLRTPSTDQIQKISTQLSFYGKIESKNVFYWFQNHKARERQKRRRVSIDERREENLSSSATYFADINHQERVIETLQLFPLNSFNEGEPEKLRHHGNDSKDSSFSYKFAAEMDHHPPLDLQLSFL